MFYVEYKNCALKDLAKIPKAWQKRIIKAINELCVNPWKGKKLKGELAGVFAIRIWPYRILYLIEKQKMTIVILEIGHRQGIYN